MEENTNECLKECHGGKELLDDIVFVARSRSLVDPMGEIPAGNLTADFKGDAILQQNQNRFREVVTGNRSPIPPIIV